MNKTEITVIAVAVAAIIAVTALTAYANIYTPYRYPEYLSNQPYGQGGMMGGWMGGMMGGGMGGGMMGGNPNQNYQQTPNQTQQNYGPGMMGGMMGGGSGGMMSGGMMGGGGMMSGYYSKVPTVLTHDKAIQVAKNYLASLNNSSLVIGEFEEYSYNFYVSIVEKSTGRGVLEALIDRSTGSLNPEPQSMMWSTKFSVNGGMMGGYQRSVGEMTVKSEEALKIAQDYLNVFYPGTKADADEIVAFYGYYTIMTTLNGADYGMLSINGYTGAIWYHTWHGMFITDVKIS